MNFKHLQSFVTLVEEMHFGRAAERLHIVRPALSMQIQALENEMGGPLLVRSKDGLRLTEAGALLLSEAKRMLAHARHTKDVVRRSIRGEQGMVRVGFDGAAVMTGCLTQLLRQFRSSCPDVELSLQEVPPDKQCAAIVDGELDVGLSPNYKPGLPPGLTSIPVGSWPLTFAMASDHPLANAKRFQSKALAAEPFIVYAHDQDDAIAGVLTEILGAPPNIAHRAQSMLAALAIVAAGEGIALVPASFMEINIPGLVYRKIPGALSKSVMLVSRCDETSGAVLAFIREGVAD